jgi:hypothetical protein
MHLKMFWTKKKKFWEELLAYVPLIRRKLHRKWHLQQFFATTGTCLLWHCIAMIGGYTETPTDFVTRAAQTTTCPTILLLLCVFDAVGMCLPSCCLATTGGIHIHTHTDWWEGFMKYTLEIGLGVMTDIRNFIDWLRH